MENVFIHPTAEVSEKAVIGEGTRIWHFAQVRENSKIGKNCIIGKSSYIDVDVKIGDRVKIQNFVSVYHGVVVEDDVFLGPSMTFTNDMYPRAANSDFKVYQTLVKKGASIGANSTIICGTTIGRYAMIGSGSVVTGDVPDHALVYGNPAKLRGFVCECGRRLEEEKVTPQGVVLKCSVCRKKVTIPPEVHEELDKK
ncbi:MAG: N-acetyltransferase [Candidatus Altiarchaeota archaeon]|nr:N-acetyltransferase [Candidatus Altiarchaeota archaeon]